MNAAQSPFGATMLINTNPEPRVVDCYDVTFSTGLFMSVTVDKEAGDTVDWTTSPMTVIFHLTEKPSITDPDTKLPAEDLTIFIPHVLAIQHRTQTNLKPTTEQTDDFRKTLHALTTSVN